MSGVVLICQFFSPVFQSSSLFTSCWEEVFSGSLFGPYVVKSNLEIAISLYGLPWK